MGVLAALGSWLATMVFQLFKRRLSHVLDRWSWGRKFHSAVHLPSPRPAARTTYGAIIGIRFTPFTPAGSPPPPRRIANVSTRGFSFCAAVGGVLWAAWSVGLGYVTGSATRLPFWASSLIGVGLGLAIGAAVGWSSPAAAGTGPPSSSQCSAPADPDEELDF